MEKILELLSGMWVVTAEMAPYLLFGFLMAGVLSVLMSPEWVERHLGGRGILPILKGVLLGVPLPLCSCGVIPVTASIRRHGASRGATTGFLLATPQTGVDSILATWGMLGPALGILRPAIALITGLIGGIVADLLDPGDQRSTTAKEVRSECSGGCCSTEPQGGLVARVLRYGFVTLPGDIAKALFIGILIAGLIGAFVAEDAFKAYIGGGFGAMLAMIAVGIPMYVCSTASIPIAVGFMHLGASPGAALAFLISGPATNAATIATVWSMLGRRTALVYLSTVFFGALAAGLGYDAVAPYFAGGGFSHTTHIHDMQVGWFQHGCGLVLTVIILGNLTKNWIYKRRAKTAPAAMEVPMSDTLTLKVTGMTCSHCENAVGRALRAMPGVTGVQVDRNAEHAVVSGEGLDAEGMKTAIRELGYEVD